MNPRLRVDAWLGGRGRFLRRTYFEPDTIIELCLRSNEWTGSAMPWGCAVRRLRLLPQRLLGRRRVGPVLRTVDQRRDVSEHEHGQRHRDPTAAAGRHLEALLHPRSFTVQKIASDCHRGRSAMSPRDAEPAGTSKA